MAQDRDRPDRGPAADELSQEARRQAEAGRQTAENIGEDVQRQAQAFASDVQSKAAEMASEQKEAASSGLMDLVSAIRRAADDLEHHQQPQIANVARSVAGGIEDFSQSIRRRNFQDMFSDVQRFARDHPGAFFGGAVLAGLAVARLAKSATGPSHTERSMASRSESQRHFGQGGRLAEFARDERYGRESTSGSMRQNMPGGMRESTPDRMR